MVRRISVIAVDLALVICILIATLNAVLTSQRAFAATQSSVTFDFDTGTPPLSESQNTPLSQTSNVTTAYFNSTSDPAAFSVQSYGTTFFNLSQFSGKYLYDNKPSRDALDIKFNVSITSITFIFATIEFHGGPTAEPSNITLTAYTDSIATSPVGSAIARGTWPSGGSYPQGTLTFNSSSQQFNIVRIELPYQGASAAVDFLIDNVTVTTTTDAIPEFPTTSALILSMLIAALTIFITNKKLAKNPKNSISLRNTRSHSMLDRSKSSR